jgi:ABC-type multidrug transport system ATPase subunit
MTGQINSEQITRTTSAVQAPADAVLPPAGAARAADLSPAPLAAYPTAAAGTALAVRTEGLTKRFRSGQVAVNAIDLAVPIGSVFGFLGPNGSGKTTSIRMLLGLIRPTAGHCELLGHRMPEAAAQALPAVGALVEGPAFHPYLSGRANLARLDAADRSVDPRTSRRRIDEAFERVGLLAAAGKRYRFYSLGMRQRLALAACLLRPRELLILDEPTNGLDPQGTREVRSLITELAATGVTVLLSTHLLKEVEQICTHVGVMHVGNLVAQAPLHELRAGIAPRLTITSTEPQQAAKVLREHGLQEVEVSPGHADALLGRARPEDVVTALVQAGVPVRGMAVREADLEEVFLSLTGEGFDVSG